MINQMTISVRPHSTVELGGEPWEVLENDTLAQNLILRHLDDPDRRKRAHYPNGHVIRVLDRPYRRLKQAE